MVDKIMNMDRKELMQYFKIIGLLLIIIVCLVTGLVMVFNSNTIDVELRVGDSYEITGVVPDENINFEDTDGKLEYTIIRKNDKTGVTDFVIKASKTGKITLKVKDEDGKSFKYKIKITKSAE